MYFSKLASALTVALWVSSTVGEAVSPQLQERTPIVQQINDRNSNLRRIPSRIEARNAVVLDNVVAVRQAASSTRAASSAPAAPVATEPQTTQKAAETPKPVVVQETTPKAAETTPKEVVAEPTPKPAEAVTTSSPPAAVVPNPAVVSSSSSSSPTAAVAAASSSSGKSSTTSTAPNPAATAAVANTNLDIYKTRSTETTSTDRYRITRPTRTNPIAQATDQILDKSGAGSVKLGTMSTGGLVAAMFALVAIDW